ncbi:MAG: porin, partial [Magnetovibrio sp.]|nr:porin [Magnetovibrio sp.]
MKKILLATTAVVALSTVSAEAFAADKIKLELGGFMRQFAGVVNHDEATAANTGIARSVDLMQWANSEVYFRGNTKLDNGLTVAADIQLETSTRNAAGGRQLDVSSLQISSDAMGALTVGPTTHGYDDFAVRAPLVGELDWGDTQSFGSVAATSALAATAYSQASVANSDDLGGKGMKVKYVSPNFSGAQVFGSWAAAIGGGGAITAASNTNTDTYSYGVGFSGEVGGASISADLMHAMINADYDENHVGLSVGMAGFTVAGSYINYNDLRGATAATKSNSDGSTYELGVGYETGPYSVAVAYSKSKSTGDTSVAGDNTDNRWLVSAAYDLGAG